jgi:hypothetical protein
MPTTKRLGAQASCCLWQLSIIKGLRRSYARQTYPNEVRRDGTLRTGTLKNILTILLNAYDVLSWIYAEMPVLLSCRQVYC